MVSLRRGFENNMHFKEMIQMFGGSGVILRPKQNEFRAVMDF